MRQYLHSAPQPYPLYAALLDVFRHDDDDDDDGVGNVEGTTLPTPGGNLAHPQTLPEPDTTGTETPGVGKVGNFTPTCHLVQNQSPPEAVKLPKEIREAEVAHLAHPPLAACTCAGKHDPFGNCPAA